MSLYHKKLATTKQQRSIIHNIKKNVSLQINGPQIRNEDKNH